MALYASRILLTDLRLDFIASIDCSLLSNKSSTISSSSANKANCLPASSLLNAALVGRSDDMNSFNSSSMVTKSIRSCLVIPWPLRRERMA